MPNTGQDRPVETQVIHILPSPEFRAASVLVVDDELPALRLLRLMLSAPAFHCTTASNGEEAIAALQRQKFDAVISDLPMPGVGGMELLAQARRRHTYVGFLLTTGVDDVEVGVQAMRSGAGRLPRQTSSGIRCCCKPGALPAQARARATSGDLP